jgi:hypothetical protein
MTPSWRGTSRERDDGPHARAFPTSRLRDFCSRKELITAADVAFLEGDLLVDLIDTKVTTMGITKLVPDPDLLASAYRRACQIGILNRALAAAADGARRQAAEIALPDDLVGRVRAYLAEHPEEPWDAAIARLAEDVLPGVGPDHGPSREPP